MTQSQQNLGTTNVGIQQNLGTKVDQLLDNSLIFLLFLTGLVLFLFFSNIKTFPALKLAENIQLDKIFIGTIAIVAVVERSVELFIAAWRNPQKDELEQEITVLKALTSPSAQEQQDLIDKQKKLGKNIRITKKYALWLSLLFGVMASVAGIRILEPLVNLTPFNEASQNITRLSLLSTRTSQDNQSLMQAQAMIAQLSTFHKLDLVLSALGIATGTKLFHGFPALVTDTINATRQQVNPPQHP